MSLENSPKNLVFSKKKLGKSVYKIIFIFTIINLNMKETKTTNDEIKGNLRKMKKSKVDLDKNDFTFKKYSEIENTYRAEALEQIYEQNLHQGRTISVFDSLIRK